jgi:arylformamidase
LGGEVPVEKMEYFDISQPLREGMPVWPGDQKFLCRRNQRISQGDPCNVAAVTMSLHTGTHVDAPYHFLEEGPDISNIPLDHYVGPVKVIKMEGKPFITETDLRQQDLRGVRRVLFQTRPVDLPEKEFAAGFTWLKEDGAEFLAGLCLLLVGIDTPSIDAFDSTSMTSHRILLSRGVAILEGIRLTHIMPGDYDLICLPLRFAGLDGSPVRAILCR